MEEPIKIITIDGPSGSGKGTLSALLAQKLGWNLLDSGSLYRLTALAALHQQVPLDDEEALAKVSSQLNVEFIIPTDSTALQIYLDGKPVNDAIRQEQIGLNASVLARFQKVRSSLMERQRAFATPPGLIADGRDMGTIVFPEAPVKIFLTASSEERASRRFKQLQGQKDISYEQILADVTKRDLSDMNRPIAPLKPAPDAVVIDSTNYSIENVFNKIIAILEDKRII